MRKGDPPVVVEQAFEVSVDELWTAITELQRMVKWYFPNIPEFEAKAGFRIQFNVEHEGRNFLHMWKITAVEPLKRIAYRWRYEQYPGKGEVLFELSERDGGSHLKLTMDIHEDFPADIPEFERKNCVAGWEYFINQRLKEYLESGG
jgi:uncharacterized protein YndB with AHSA1/START domain